MAGLFGAAGGQRSWWESGGIDRIGARLLHIPGQRVELRQHAGVASGCALSANGVGGEVVDLPGAGWAVLAGGLLVGEGRWHSLIPRLIAKLRASAGNLTECLDDVDGVFALAAYDHVSQRLVIVNDFTGALPVYFAQTNGGLLWASEVKGIAREMSSAADLDADRLKEFLSNGWVRPPFTYFRGVEELHPSEALLFDCKTGVLARVATGRSLDDPPLARPTEIAFEEAKEELKRLLRRAVQRRLQSSESVAVTLSGGLDSRFLAAETARNLKPRLVTFGLASSREVAIAREVARRLGAAYEFVEVNATNWLAERARAIWMTDGLMDLKDCHIIHVASRLVSAGLVFDGFFGDITIGRKPLYIAPSSGVAVNRFLRMNRFTAFGPRIEMNYSSLTCPYVDHELVSFMDQLPDEYKRDSRIYCLAIGELHPSLFSEIPWLTLRRPCYPYRQPTRFDRELGTLRHRAEQVAQWAAGITLTRDSTLHYGIWLRREPFRQIFMRLIYGTGGRLRQVLPVPSASDVFSRIPTRKHLRQPTRLLTLETWLRQYFDTSGAASFEELA